MKAPAWKRGDLCDCGGGLCYVLAPPSKRGKLAQIQDIEDGQRWRVQVMLLRRPTTAQLKAAAKRLAGTVAQAQTAMGHIAFELNRRANP